MSNSVLNLVKICCVLLASAVSAATASPMTEYKNAVLVDHSINDGDSFMVLMDGKTYHLRLYYVDTPEVQINTLHDARRVQEQARYFGLERPERVVWLGQQASDFTRQVLAQPFTVFTAHSRALGGPGSERIYAFIVTAAGRDLGELLVENGLARNFGVTRERYDGAAIRDVELGLNDLEASAMLAHRGIWSETNPRLMVQERAKQRQEKLDIKEILSPAVRLTDDPVNVNQAAQNDLERLPGVGPVMASRIIENRPYHSVDELLKVPGIGPRTLETIRPFIRVNGEPSDNG